MNLNTLLDPLAIAVLLVMVLLYPWSSVWDHRRLLRWTAEKLPNARMRHYKWVTTWEWISVVVLLAWWFWTGRPAAPLGLVPTPSGWQWLAIAVGAVLSVFLILQMVSATRSPKSLSDVRKNLGNLEALVARNPSELRAFIGLSITAGICEEILYRGLLLAVLATAIGTWPAVFVSSVIFGLGHLYQGPLGVVKTAIAGLTFALITLFSGSLFTAIIVHIIMDISGGRIMSAAIALPPEHKMDKD